MLERALDMPPGEHPTKSGAVSLTLAHSSLLNWIAAANCQKCPPYACHVNILACSLVLHSVARQHDNAATYVELEQRQAISITEHDFWVEVEFERHCCYSYISSRPFSIFDITYCAYREFRDCNGLYNSKETKVQQQDDEHHDEYTRV